MIRRVGGLLVRREHGRSLDRPAAGGEDALRPLLAGDPEDLVEPVNAPVAERAVGVVEILAEAARMDARG